ncbi:hypothetical protein [Lyngbya sp. PCC 8106]|uniref:hypothetical protein n=1 Tax=Lyngbya sp. (strain PCC 8106) TaxID=313612 RepID=UPI0000EACF4D|nr:hypothetical protein [Lyngbya sp. PCC 8106]EAW33606.1 hypothetical protein L8106_29435 [Lyngbya sp. PCC 8106]
MNWMKIFWRRLSQMTLMTVLVSGLWILGFSLTSAQAAPNLIGNTDETGLTGERLSAVINCLPKELSEPDLGRALKEMGNDYLERTFQLKDNPKLNQAEIAFGQCLEGKGYTLRAEQFRNLQQES